MSHFLFPDTSLSIWGEAEEWNYSLHPRSCPLLMSSCDQSLQGREKERGKGGRWEDRGREMGKRKRRELDRQRDGETD